MGFLASQFAYGRIGIMKAFLYNFFRRMGESPERFLIKGDWSSLAGLYYRFQKTEEIIRLVTVLRYVIDGWGSLGSLIRSLYEGDTREAVWRLREQIGLDGRELIFFFPKRLKSSPLKRWNLYLRWMVRKDAIDEGLWDFIDPENLVVPLDTHLYKIGRCMGWTERKSPTWNAALDITRALKEVCPEDPLRYDFFLCHRVGIGAGCSGRRSGKCDEKCLLLMKVKEKVE